VGGLQETSWTDRLDDAIIGAYGLVGIAVIWQFRHELLRHEEIKDSVRWGFACLAASVVCDALSNRNDILAWLSGDPKVGAMLTRWFAVGDGSFTLVAEACFVAGFYLSWKAEKYPAYPSKGTGANGATDS
jgi:hypothetical protein